MIFFYMNPILIAAAIIPAIFLLVKVYKADRLEREPPLLLLSLVLYGIIATGLAMVTERLGSVILMIIHRPHPDLSTAENILLMLRPNQKYTLTEAKVLDTALILHMEHGGGNNSTFTTRVVTSSGSDTYSTMAAALCSLKGPRHGGANIKVIEMIQDIKSHLHDWTDPEETSAYLRKLLNKEAFDHSGLIYGMGHAVYSISDPREQILRSFVNQLAVEKGRQDDLALYRNIEEEAPKLISKNRPIYKGVSANIDLYSGFLYDLLGIPVELYTPLFAIARIVGWSAHRIEELVCMNKIIRPAYMSVMRERG